MFWYHVLDYFFLIFHTVFTLFNIIGWIWKKTRLANFITLSLTGLSWFGLGIFYGWGFCFLTEWHWQVLHKLGNTNLPYSYIKYILARLLGLQVGEELANMGTLVVFILAFMLSVWFNFIRKLIFRKQATKK
ncbi:MAG TPA: DUF2784 domain-containing protein [Bacteroidales bacterium]|nr:DUF2784 domain-containing protein [Bacteroidales bacterium]